MMAVTESEVLSLTLPARVPSSFDAGPEQGGTTGPAGELRGLRARIGSEFYRQYGKRAIDIVLSLLGMALAAPVIAIVALLVALDGGKPFFRQWRVGRDGEQFKCIKIRTMSTDANKRLQEILATDKAAWEEWASSQKLTNDPRITRLGRILRKTSLDELPQLWNVLVGDMSLVGPRPVVPDELERYGTHATAYLRLRPGATGPWQVVANRNDMTYYRRVLMDVRYERSLSFLGDLEILVKTLGIVLQPSGK